ncbi:hypothetical protein [Psychrobacter sp. JCM 18901]|uniref:hypothetical protein n=1 Tax=Psychrobacter sp. JCM 18901 TaxID=1298609 RepID=UPI0021C2C05B|nr:hypothetical protein [Psychrobacter sp. JCM 18901]
MWLSGTLAAKIWAFFYLLSGCPPLTNIFDTQIALSYLTGQLQMGYQQALADQLDMHIDKEHSQSDWLQRPLTDEQEQYAIDDVRYLPALYLSIEHALKAQGLYDYVWADCQLYASDLYDTQHVEDEAMYLTMADYRYNSQQMAILKGVATWREELARATNQPRTFVIKNKQYERLSLKSQTACESWHIKQPCTVVCCDYMAKSC